nr:hypothetical protein CFP56_09381 [Quercus suber]
MSQVHGHDHVSSVKRAWVIAPSITAHLSIASWLPVKRFRSFASLRHAVSNWFSKTLAYVQRMRQQEQLKKVSVMERTEAPPDHKRLQSLTRLDVIAAMVEGYNQQPRSPGLSSPAKELEACMSTHDKGTGAHNRVDRHLHITFLAPHVRHKAVTSVVRSTDTACSPRSVIKRARRVTSIGSCDNKHSTLCWLRGLKQIGRHKKIRSGIPVTQAKSTIAKRLRGLPAPGSLFNMGNKPSSNSGSLSPDDESIRSIARSPLRKGRKSSTSLFGRIDSKSPLPRPTTATTLVVADRGDSSETDASRDESSPSKISDDLLHGSRTSPLKMAAHQPGSSNESSTRPLSASDTIRDSRTVSSSGWSDIARRPSADVHSSPVPPRSTLLSPTIPAPSPLPEDSPHKYGLRDCADTPEALKAPSPGQEADANKSQRRGSGTATTLQSASSFLNGLSTSRRRAESHSRMSEISSRARTQCPMSRPGPRPPSRSLAIHSASAVQFRSYNAADNQSRQLGHNFKSSGFVYAHPLDITQLKCYTSHAKLHPSNNRHAPVECSVCHMDDDAEHWTCMWCAIRMCCYCRKDFDKAGMYGLKKRIRMAELGNSVVDAGE